MIKNIIEKIKKDQLPHFVVFTPTQKDLGNHELFDKWQFDLLEEIIFNVGQKKINIKNFDFFHVDILNIKTENKNYTIEDFNEFFHFGGTRPIELPSKFVIIQDAHKLTPIVSNKLLKSLEEPEIRQYIFLMNPQNTTLLATIKSRAIEMRVDLGPNIKSDCEKIKTKAEFLNYLKTYIDENNAEILTSYLNQTEQLHNTIKSLSSDFDLYYKIEQLPLTLTQSIAPDFNAMSKIQAHMQWINTSRQFHNSQDERLIQSLYLIKNTFNQLP